MKNPMAAVRLTRLSEPVLTALERFHGGCPSLRAKGVDRIDLTRPSRGNNASKQRCEAEDRHRSREQKRTVRGRLIQLRRNEAAQRERCREANGQTDCDRAHTLVNDQT